MMRYEPSVRTADGFLRRQNLHAEALRLHHRAPRKIAAAEARRKTEIIFDARTHSRLAAGRLPLDHHRVQAFRRSVNGGGQACRPSTDNRQIIEAGLRAGSQPHLLRNVGRRLSRSLVPSGNSTMGSLAVSGPRASSRLLVSGSLAESSTSIH